VRLFTDPTRAYFTSHELALLRDLSGEGCAVSREPGGGGSNSVPNIKVARGERALARALAAVLARHYSAPFELRDVFSPGDRDVYINLGEQVTRPAPRRVWRPKGGRGGGGLGGGRGEGGGRGYGGYGGRGRRW